MFTDNLLFAACQRCVSTVSLVMLGFIVLANISVKGASITVTNLSFESETTNYFPTVAPTGWNTTYAYGKVITASSVSISGASGYNIAEANGPMYQSLGMNFVVGNTYTLNFSLGALTGGLATKGFQAAFVANESNTGGGGLNKLANESNIFIDDSAISRGSLSSYSLSYVATNTSAIVLGFSDFYGNGNNLRPFFDNVSVTVVPEPTTVISGLLISCGVAFHIFRVRRQMCKSV